MSAGLRTLTLVICWSVPLAPAGRGAAAPAEPIGLQKGDEFTFVGKVAEVVDRPAKQFRRNHDLELRVFVLDRNEKWADAVVLTRLMRTDDVVSDAVGALTGEAQKAALPLIRPDIVRIHSDGTVHLLTPPGPPPLKLDANTPAHALPPIPLDVFAPSEFGLFPPRPPRNNTGDPWAVAAGSTRPDETWQVQDFKFLNAERCQYLVMNQQSADWLKPAGGQAWHRAEEVWVSTQDGTARKIHRVIKQRDGRADVPAAWIEVKYELKNQTNLNGRTFDRTRRAIEMAYATLSEARTLISPKQVEARLAKLDACLGENDLGSAYREVLVAAKLALEAAKRGEAAPVQLTPMPPLVSSRPRWPEPGDIAPDVCAGNFRLTDHKGKPVVLIFFKPEGETTDLSLAIADALEKRYGAKVAVVPLVVYGKVASAMKSRDRMKLAIPLRDGTTAATAYGVETVPRFAVIDSVGKVRWTFAGIGTETGFLVKEQVDHLVAPTSPNAPPGITPAAGPISLPPIPRP